jgi:hypothetical protein
MAGKFTRRHPAPRPTGGATMQLDKCDWLVEVLSTKEVLIITDCTYLELCKELDQKYPSDWDIWDRE